MPGVSVASTVLNEVDDIDALVESLMRQSLAPAEVIVVDGGSSDGTWEHLQAARSKYPTLVPIRDESCSLKSSPGPIARGRNRGIRAASSEVVACVDAGCIYPSDWLAKLTAPILGGDSEYSVGGSYIDCAEATVWDLASAPFFGVKLNPDASTKSCTARSMAFRKALWQRVGGFDETVFLGEDTVFDSCEDGVVEPFAAKVGDRCTKAMISGCGFRARRKLRLEQRRDKEQVRGRFDGAAFFVLGAAGHDREARFHRHPFELGVHFVVAEEFFLDDFLSVIRGEIGAGTQANLADFSGELGRVRIAVGNGAGDGIDDDVLSVRIFFGGGGVANAEHVAGALDERVLKAAAGAEKWPVVDAGELNAFEHAVETLVGAAR
jgi:glycosyltransferase involved in cell wall biosynthesis